LTTAKRAKKLVEDAKKTGERKIKRSRPLGKNKTNINIHVEIWSTVHIFHMPKLTFLFSLILACGDPLGSNMIWFQVFQTLQKQIDTRNRSMISFAYICVRIKTIRTESCRPKPSIKKIKPLRLPNVKHAKSIGHRNAARWKSILFSFVSLLAFNQNQTRLRNESRVFKTIDEVEMLSKDERWELCSMICSM